MRRWLLLIVLIISLLAVIPAKVAVGNSELGTAARSMDTERYILSTNPVLYYPLWQKDGTRISTNDGYGHTATLTGTSYFPQGRVFSGTTDRISFASTSALDITGAFTVEVWVNYSVSNNNKALINKWSFADGYAWSLATGLNVNADKIAFYARQGGVSKGAISVATYNDGLWHHIFGLMDGSNVLVEIDGTLATGDAITAIDSSTTAVAIAGLDDSGGLIGSIGEVRIYNRYLTVQEKQRNFLATKWRYR